MISRFSNQNLIWIDLECPTRHEIAMLAEEYQLHPIVSSELLHPSERAKVDIYENSIYLVLHFPTQNRTTGQYQETEVDFILFDNTLITTHYEQVNPLHDFAKTFEAGTYLSHGKGSHAGFLFFHALRELYKHTLYMIESTERDIRDIEKHIFLGEEAQMVSRISLTNRELIDIHQATRYHREPLFSLMDAAKHLYGDEFAYYVNSLIGEAERIEHMAQEHRQTLRDLRETNDSLLSTKTNQIIRRLTVVNIILLPLGLITWIFGMNSKFLSLDEPKNIIAVFTAMIVICLISVIYFRHKKWL